MDCLSMLKTVFLLVLVTCSIYGKVIVNENHLPDVTSNLVEHEAKAVSSIVLESLFHKKNIKNIILNETNSDEHENKTSVNSEIHEFAETNKSDINDNLINPVDHEATPVPSIVLESLFHKKNIKNIILNETNSDEHENKTSVNFEIHECAAETNKSDINDNLINPVDHEATPVPSIVLESLFHKKNIKNIILNETNSDEHENKTSVNFEIHECAAETNKSDINDNLINPDEHVRCETPAKVDNGIALILTPYIENGQVAEARNASKVNPDVFLGYESYSGFITVNKTYDSNTFFWYFPVLKKPVNETPWIIWLQGGPGASSLTGLFDEIGPFKLNSVNELTHNPFSWIHNHSLVFIDNPLGTGYSYTNHVDGYNHDMRECGRNLLETVHQFLQVFPELRSAPLYVAGESYAGKYVPALSMELHKHKDLPGFDINLEGMMVGNGYVDPSMISQITLPFYYFGLLSKEQIGIVDPLLKSFQQNIANNDSIGAKDNWNTLIAVLIFLSHQKHAYNFLKDDLSVGHYVNFLKSSEVKRAIHVGDIKFSFVNLTVNAKMSPDFLSSSKPLFEELLEHYKVLMYCGQLDQMLPCVFTSDHFRTWKWSGSSAFLEAARYPYIYKTKLAGYHKTGGQLTEVVVRGAGHMVPVDQPGPIQNLVARWTHSKPLSHRFGNVEGSFIQELLRNHTVVYL